MKDPSMMRFVRYDIRLTVLLRLNGGKYTLVYVCFILYVLLPTNCSSNAVRTKSLFTVAVQSLVYLQPIFFTVQI